MRALGFEESRADAAGNAVGVLGRGPRRIVLLGHIDTVPGEIPVQVEDGVLHGRGSVDAKGPLAAFVDAAARVGERPGWQIVVIGAVDEERNSSGARHVVDRYRPEFAVIGEPSGWERVTLGYKGSAWAEVTLRRPLSHTASGEQSAAEAAFEAWSQVQEWTQAYNQGKASAFEQVLPTLRGLDSGADGFEEWARLRIGVRLPPELPPEDWYLQLGSLPGIPAVEPTGYPIPAYRSDKRSPLVRAFLGGIRAAGGQPGFVLKTGTADLNIVAPVWGCPAAAYGPGDSSLDHTPEERLSLAEYTRAVDVLRVVLERLTG